MNLDKTLVGNDKFEIQHVMLFKITGLDEVIKENVRGKSTEV